MVCQLNRTGQPDSLRITRLIGPNLSLLCSVSDYLDLRMSPRNIVSRFVFDRELEQLVAVLVNQVESFSAFRVFSKHRYLNYSPAKRRRCSSAAIVDHFTRPFSSFQATLRPIIFG